MSAPWRAPGAARRVASPRCMWCHAAAMADEGEERNRRLATAAALIVVGAVAAVLQLPGLGQTPFHTRGEPREAVVVQDLVARGDWVLPRRNGTALPRKPPLFYWLGGAAATARGVVDEAAVRLPSALLSGAAALLLTLVVALAVTPRAGALAGLVLLTSFEWLRAATAARVDMTLAFGLTLVFAGLLRFQATGGSAARLLVWAGVIWATLAKGIPGLAIPALQVALLCLVARSLAPLRTLRPLRGALVVLVVVGAWYAAAALQGGTAFLSIVASENLHRIAGSGPIDVGHRHSALYLAGVLLAGLLPWTLLLPSVAAAMWRARPSWSRADPRRFALLWMIAVFLPHALATSKRGVYLLPLYPAVALLIGWWADQAIATRAPLPVLRRLVTALAAILALLVGTLAVLAAAQWAGLPVLDGLVGLARGRTRADVAAVVDALGSGGALGAVLLAAAAAAALLAALAAPRAAAAAVIGGLVAGTAAVALTVRLTVMPTIAGAQTPRSFVAAVRAALADPAALHTVPSLDYATLFYWGAPLPVYDPGTPAAAPPRYLLLAEEAWARATPRLRAQYRRLPLPPAPRASGGTPVVLERADE